MNTISNYNEKYLNIFDEKHIQENYIKFLLDLFKTKYWINSISNNSQSFLNKDDLHYLQLKAFGSEDKIETYEQYKSKYPYEFAIRTTLVDIIKATPVYKLIKLHNYLVEHDDTCRGMYDLIYSFSIDDNTSNPVSDRLELIREWINKSGIIDKNYLEITYDTPMEMHEIPFYRWMDIIPDYIIYNKYPCNIKPKPYVCIVTGDIRDRLILPERMALYIYQRQKHYYQILKEFDIPELYEFLDKIMEYKETDVIKGDK